MNREHAILGRNRCVAVNPSDTAPALIALDAKMIVENTGGPSVHDAEDFFIGPAIDITRSGTGIKLFKAFLDFASPCLADRITFRELVFRIFHHSLKVLS